MKLVKSLLFISAASLATISGAAAADLGGIKKPAPAEYVRVCNAYGAGFFYIPGTQTCLKVGGRARFEFEYQQPRNANDGNGSGVGFRSIGRLILDARTQSEYGPVRAFVRIDTQYRTGNFASGSGERFGISTVRQQGSGYAQKQTVIDLESAFIQFAGFTAGKLASFYEFGADQSFMGTGGVAGYSVMQLAYTATFGSGFSATLAIEDPVNRQQAIGYVNVANTVFAPTGVALPAQGVSTHAAYGSAKTVPDIVGALRVDQGWGAAQVSGLLHNITYGYQANGINPDADWGFAVQGGVKVNLPMIAPGDAIWLQANYTQGAIETLVSSFCGYGSNGICALGKTNSSGFVGNIADFDAVYGGTPTVGFSTKLTTGYALVAAFQHYWSPTIRSSVTGSYTKIDYAGSTNLADNTIFVGAVNTVWSPIAGLDIGGEVQYANVKGGRGISTTGTTRFTPGSGGSSQDQWNFLLRVQRDF